MGLKANLGRLETRLNCVELAKEQDTGAGVLYTVQWGTQTKKKWEESIIKGKGEIIQEGINQ